MFACTIYLDTDSKGMKTSQDLFTKTSNGSSHIKSLVIRNVLTVYNHAPFLEIKS